MSHTSSRRSQAKTLFETAFNALASMAGRLVAQTTQSAVLALDNLNVPPLGRRAEAKNRDHGGDQRQTAPPPLQRYGDWVL